MNTALYRDIASNLQSYIRNAHKKLEGDINKGKFNHTTKAIDEIAEGVANAIAAHDSAFNVNQFTEAVFTE